MVLSNVIEGRTVFISLSFFLFFGMIIIIIIMIRHFNKKPND